MSICIVFLVFLCVLFGARFVKTTQCMPWVLFPFQSETAADVRMVFVISGGSLAVQDQR